MNAPFRNPAPIGSREELREFIAQHLALAVVHIEHGVDYANLGSDTALGYALRAASGYMNAAVATYSDLTKEAARD